MKINPIIPIWLMAVICVVILFFRRKKAAYIRQIVAVILLFVMNLRIMIPDMTVKKTDVEMNTRVLFVIDNTLSMIANDCDDNRQRMEAVKEDCEYITDELAGSKFAIITFDNVAEVVSPYTGNTEFVKNAIQSIRPLDSLYAKGTSFEAPIDDIKRMLDSIEDEKCNKIIFYISDGEITNGDDMPSYKEISELADGGAVLGYGSEEGGKMYVDEYGDGEEAIKDPDTYKDAISKIDEDNLKKIAKDMGLNYVKMDSKKDIDKVLKDIRDNSDAIENENDTKGYADIHYFFAIPLIILAAYELYTMKRK